MAVLSCMYGRAEQLVPCSVHPDPDWTPASPARACSLVREHGSLPNSMLVAPLNEQHRGLLGCPSQIWYTSGGGDVGFHEEFKVNQKIFLPGAWVGIPMGSHLS